DGRYHSHSYYDIPVLDAAGTRAVAYRTSFTGRQPTPSDAVEVGLVDLEGRGEWQALGTTTAWSWQQGPMAQWVPGRDAVVWNERGPDGFVARHRDLAGGTDTVLPRPIYALSPTEPFGLSLDMGRLEALRPGYGYALDAPADDLERHPETSGVWRTPLDGGPPRLILSLDAAVAWLRPLLPWRERLRHRVRRYAYWFNHAKIAPGGRRFTVKLRWRVPGGPWTNAQGVSLTADMDGGDLRLLADATSHVIWQTDDTAYFWREGELALYRDTAPRGTRLGRIGDGVIGKNVHLRHLPPAPSADPPAYVFDTPYAEEIEVKLLDPGTNAARTVARFGNHMPPRGPFRCDLHPVPDASGARIVVTSLQDGGRQLYLLSRRA
ncbi:MAG: hypothetical protein AAF390_06430, partial [Pseudomonadota bacterium]